MNENHEFDYTVTKKMEGKYLVCRMLMVLGYIFFGSVYFFGLAMAHLYPLMAFVILLEWILIFFTWRYVSIEYKYETVSGGIRFYKVYGGKKKKLLLDKRIREFSCIKPYTNEAKAELEKIRFVEKHVCTRSQKDNTDCFYAVYNVGNDKGIIIFEATQASLKILRFYNADTVIAATRF